MPPGEGREVLDVLHAVERLPAQLLDLGCGRRRALQRDGAEEDVTCLLYTSPSPRD